MEIRTYRKEFQGANCLVANVGSNCPQGGDSGHGGRTVMSFEDMGGSVLDVTVLDENGNEQKVVQASKVTLVFGGDSEHETAIRALEFMLGVLRKEQPVLDTADSSKMEMID